MFPRTDTRKNNSLPLKLLEVLEINAVHSGCRNISTYDVHLWMKLGLCSFSESLMSQKFDGSSLKRNILSASSLAGLVWVLMISALLLMPSHGVLSSLQSSCGAFEFQSFGVMTYDHFCVFMSLKLSHPSIFLLLSSFIVPDYHFLFYFDKCTFLVFFLSCSFLSALLISCLNLCDFCCLEGSSCGHYRPLSWSVIITAADCIFIIKLYFTLNFLFLLSRTDRFVVGHPGGQLPAHCGDFLPFDWIFWTHWQSFEI